MKEQGSRSCQRTLAFCHRPANGCLRCTSRCVASVRRVLPYASLFTYSRSFQPRAMFSVSIPSASCTFSPHRQPFPVCSCEQTESRFTPAQSCSSLRFRFNQQPHEFPYRNCWPFFWQSNPPTTPCLPNPTPNLPPHPPPTARPRSVPSSAPEEPWGAQRERLVW